MGKKKNNRSKKFMPSHLNNMNSICHQKCVENVDSLDNTGLCESKLPNNTENVQAGVSFETYHSTNERKVGREYYVNSLCQICKGELKERVQCPKCQLVTYCCQEHRREHWPTHTDLCTAVVQLCQERQVDHIMQGARNLSPDNFRTFRFQNMVECERIVERPLEKWEREIFIFPPVCGICNEFNVENLVVCKRCLHIQYCKRHQTNSHKDWCKYLLRYKSIVKNQAKLGVSCPEIPICKLSVNLPYLISMDSTLERLRKNVNEFEYFELTDIVTYPLTSLYVLLLLLKNTKLSIQKHLTVHIIGAEQDFEAHKLEKWEYYILHLIPELKTLTIDFVGPELNSSLKTSSGIECVQCLKAKKSVTYNFHNELYHTLCNSSKISSPNLICVFNPGLYRATGFNGQDSWTPTIKSMLGQNCPILTTAYTHKEIALDVSAVKLAHNVYLEIEPMANPFSSLKPSLNFVSDEDSPVIFKNNFYCVMSKQ